MTNYFPQFNWSLRALVQADIAARSSQELGDGVIAIS
jgi:hypothetical protein